MADKREPPVNYEAGEQEVMDEVEAEIELLDQDYIEEEDTTDAVDKQVSTPEELATQQRIEALKGRLEGGESSTATTMKEIAETMKSLRATPQTPEIVETVEDLAELRKKLSDGFYDDPMTAVDTWVDKRLARYEKEKLQPAFNQMAGVLRDTALDSSKRSIEADETGKFVMNKYSDEVEKLITSNQIQIGPGAYKKAVSQVASEHLDELIDWKIEQRGKAVTETDAATRMPGKNAAPQGGTAAPAPSKKVQVSRAAQDAIYAMADPEVEGSGRFLEYIGFKHQSGGTYKWLTQ